MTIYNSDVLSFSILNLSIVLCLVLTVDSWPAYRFPRRPVRWSGIPISLRIFHSLLWSIQSKTLVVVKEAEVDVFLKFPCFFYDPTNVGNLISGSSAFSKSCLYIWKFLVQGLLKPSLKDFEHNSTRMWNENSCTVILTFFPLPSLEFQWKLTFLVLWPLLSFPNMLTYWVQHS